MLLVDRLAALGSAAAIMLLAGPAGAACFDVIGCTDQRHIQLPELRQLSCESLWLARNTIYDEHGFCFQGSRELRTFSNEGCWNSTKPRTHREMTEMERTNLTRIQHIEREFGCPY